MDEQLLAGDDPPGITPPLAALPAEEPGGVRSAADPAVAGRGAGP